MRNEKGQFLKNKKKPKEMKEKISESLRNNKNATKLTSEELKRDAYDQYCQWIANGNSMKSFVYVNEEEGISVTWETIDKYIKENPTDFPPNKKKEAEAQSLNVWENKGINMMMGNVKGCQPAIYQMFMRNKFGWDKNTEITHTFEPEARRLLQKWEGNDD